jgi:hypothetical protein
MVLLRFLIYLSQFRNALSPRIERWIQDGIFQLQRRAYEDQSEWQDIDKEIPVTVTRVKLQDLPRTKTLTFASTASASSVTVGSVPLTSFPGPQTQQMGSAPPPVSVSQMDMGSAPMATPGTRSPSEPPSPAVTSRTRFSGDSARTAQSMPCRTSDVVLPASRYAVPGACVPVPLQMDNGPCDNYSHAGRA